MTTWKMALTPYGWSLFYHGQLVASADDPRSLLTLVARDDQ